MPELSLEYCGHCGFEVGYSEVLEDTEITAALDPKDGWISPVHRILPDRGLGGHLSSSNYASLARKMYVGETLSPLLLKKHAGNLSHLAEVREDALLKAVRSDVLQALKSNYPDDAVSDLAARLVVEQVRRWRADYPMLSTSKGVRAQLVANVLRQVEQFFPRHRSEGNRVTSGPEDKS
jgi:hypothetical protein